MKLLTFLVLATFFISGCGKSEALDEEEQEYVHLTIALSKIKASARDSAHYERLRDSVFRAFSTTKAAFTAKTESFADKPERTSIIFRAIGDSLRVR